jgi:hypothetical protein
VEYSFSYLRYCEQLVTMVNARTETVQSVSYLTETLPTQLPPIFEQAQHTTANHRKNIVALRKIQVACATVTEETSKGTKLVGEKAFNTLFVDMVNRVLRTRQSKVSSWLGVGVRTNNVQIWPVDRKAKKTSTRPQPALSIDF